MSITFLSGWSGLPCLYPTVATQANFIVPFYSHTVSEINDALNDGGDLLIAWSTGAHLALNQISLIGDKFSEIILIAPFLDFTSSVPARIIERMHSRLLREPEATVNDFWQRCGATQGCPTLTKPQVGELAAGLEFLMTSKIHPSHCHTALTLVHCHQDRVVIPETFDDVAHALPQAKILSCAGPHMLPEAELLRIMTYVSGTTFL